MHMKGWDLDQQMRIFGPNDEFRFENLKLGEIGKHQSGNAVVLKCGCRSSYSTSYGCTMANTNCNL